MRFTALPSALNAALSGCSYVATHQLNDTITVYVADPAGSEYVPLGAFPVTVHAASTRVEGNAMAPSTTTLYAIFVAISAAMVLGLIQLFSWMQTWCHPVRADLLPPTSARACVTFALPFPPPPPPPTHHHTHPPPHHLLWSVPAELFSGRG